VTGGKVRPETYFVNKEKQKVKEKVYKHPVYLRLKEALNASTDAEVAKRLGVTKQSVNGWKRSGKVKRSRLESVASLTGVSLGWLLTGEAEKYLTQKRVDVELSQSLQREEFARSVTVSVSPQSHSLPVAAELVNNQLVKIEGARYMEIPESIGSKDSVLVFVNDEIWLDEGIQPGDVIVAEPISGELPNGRTVIALCDGKPICRRFELRGQLAHFSALQSGPDYSFPIELVELRFTVTALVHSLKKG
jgi:transcriptional regulator with XRE-family HTH domain